MSKPKRRRMTTKAISPAHSFYNRWAIEFQECSSRDQLEDIVVICASDWHQRTRREEHTQQVDPPPPRPPDPARTHHGQRRVQSRQQQRVRHKATPGDGLRPGNFRHFSNATPDGPSAKRSKRARALEESARDQLKRPQFSSDEHTNRPVRRPMQYLKPGPSTTIASGPLLHKTKSTC